MESQSDIQQSSSPSYPDTPSPHSDTNHQSPSPGGSNALRQQRAHASLGPKATIPSRTLQRGERNRKQPSRYHSESDHSASRVSDEPLTVKEALESPQSEHWELVK